MKTGKHHIDSLRDGRIVYLNGEAVTDVVDHPAYRRAIQSVAHLYDLQAAPDNHDVMTFISPTSGGRVNRCWQLPRSYDELVQRRHALTAWAESSYGFMGRSPDHVASCLGGMIMLPSSVADFANPEIAPYIHKTQQSPVVDSTDRVKLFKLAWDAVGSEFASRHQQYEMFYASATFVTRGHAFRTCDWEGATALVDDFLSRYDLPETTP
jgi:aromatic ring hydroxylase